MADPEARPQAAGRKTRSVFSFDVMDYIKNVPVLASLNAADHKKLEENLIEIRFKEGDKIITQGEQGKEFFLIKEGQATVSVSHQDGTVQQVADLEAGDYFGEAALIHEGKRGATVTATSNVLCLSLDHTTFQKLFGQDHFKHTFAHRNAVSAEKFRQHAGSMSMRVVEKPDDVKDTIRQAVKDNLLFQNLEDAQIEQIVDHMFGREAVADEEIIKQGDFGDNFYVLEKGKVEIIVDGKHVADWESGRSFGELALMYNSARAATVKSTTDSMLWALDRITFRRILRNVSEATLHETEEFLAKVPLLSALLRLERSALAGAMEEHSFKAGRQIAKQGEVGDTFYIIREGKAVVTKTDETGSEEEVGTLTPGAYFGERALLTKEPRAATVTVVGGPMRCLTLDSQSFEALLGPLTELMNRKIEDYERRSSTRSVKDPHARPSHFLDVKFEDLEVIGLLGTGSFGKVELVRDSASGKTFALKAVKKQQVVQLGQQEHIMNEKRVMAKLSAHYLVRLWQTYNRGDTLFFLLEVALGGELFTILRDATAFEEDTARFFAACVTRAFEEMHDQSLVHRDLKPENLLLDRDGYLKLTDFGFAKEVRERTFTLCGTPDYLAPEVVSGRGHGKGVDWWTLGILIYEMIASYPPFYDEDQMRTYQKILSVDFRFPKQFSPEACDLITKLLNPKPSQRLGVIKGGAKLVREHAWFKGFDWDALDKRTMKAPIVPKVAGDTDLSNFVDYPEEPTELPPYIDDGSGWDGDF